MKILLIGIDHKYQRRDPSLQLHEIELFRERLSSLIHGGVVDLVAEEFSRDALVECSLESTCIKEISDLFGVTHLYCDPGIEDRRKHAIWSINQCQAAIFTGNADHSIFSLMNDRREDFWIEKLGQVQFTSGLFLCGKNHLNTFRVKLCRAGFLVSVGEL